MAAHERCCLSGIRWWAAVADRCGWPCAPTSTQRTRTQWDATYFIGQPSYNTTLSGPIISSDRRADGTLLALAHRSASLCPVLRAATCKRWLLLVLVLIRCPHPPPVPANPPEPPTLRKDDRHIIGKGDCIRHRYGPERARAGPGSTNRPMPLIQYDRRLSRTWTPSSSAPPSCSPLPPVPASQHAARQSHPKVPPIRGIPPHGS
jgi:hypothetical protein